MNKKSLDSRYIQIEIEIKRHLEDVRLNKSAHFHRYGLIMKFIRRINNGAYISFWGLILSWFMSTQVSTALDFFGITYFSSFVFLTNNVFPIFFVVVGVFATTLQFAGSYNELSQAHWGAAMRYQRIYRRLVNWKSDCPSVEYAEEYWREIVAIRQAITDANEDSPDLDGSDYEYAISQIKSGSVDYEVDG